MFGIEAAAAVCGMMANMEEQKAEDAAIASALPSDREAIRERFARRRHEARMESIERDKVSAMEAQSSGILPFIFGMIIGGSGK
jgi:hypothetical protein